MIFYLLFLFALLLLLVTVVVRWLTNKRRRRAYTVGFSMREPEISTQQTQPQKLLDLESTAEFGDDEEELSEVEELSELDEELDYEAQ